MERSIVSVNTGKGYPVIIEAGLLHSSGELISQLVRLCRVALISDETVAQLYAGAVSASLSRAGFSVLRLSFPAGEASKTPETLYKLLTKLGEAQLDRDDLVVALGGGVTGDIAGFASAIYKRGIRLVQIPTTLLAMADSSVGGKTAVNMPCGKNLLGAFKQPELVICDTSALSTLSDEEFSCGMAEIIKCSMLCGEKLPAAAFPAGRGLLTESALREILHRCISIKAELVSKDERDCGERRLLNFGHTFGHAIECASGYSVSHGQAVSLGMLIITRAAELCGKCAPDTASRLQSLLEDYELPVKTELSAESLIPYIYEDKKRSGEQLALVLPTQLGHCVIEETPLPQAERLLRTGLEAMR